MGMFPYDCIYCGGGYDRCGADHDHDHEEDEDEVEPCEGGQFCWEPDCVLYPHAVVETKEGLPPLDLSTLAPFYPLEYDGYGNYSDADVVVKGQHIHFVDEEDGGFDATEEHGYTVSVKVACRSCHEANWKAPKDTKARQIAQATAELAAATQTAKEIAAKIRTLNLSLKTAREEKKTTAAKITDLKIRLAALKA